MSQTPPAISSTGEDNPELMYKGLGHVVRALHDALTWVGADEILAEASNEFPSARERLNHVAVLTEKAANTVLSTVENTLPLQQATTKNADKLLSQWDQSSLQDLTKEELLELAANTRAFIGETKSTCEMTEKALSDIMMAQDFQDLTGQLIKKVLIITQAVEHELAQILLDNAPTELKEKAIELMEGPSVPNAALEQDDVDNLLDSLGF